MALTAAKFRPNYCRDGPEVAPTGRADSGLSLPLRGKIASTVTADIQLAADNVLVLHAEGTRSGERAFFAEPPTHPAMVCRKALTRPKRGGL